MGTSFELLGIANLILDEIYHGGSQKNVGDDPISKLLGTGNMGGFRYLGNLKNGAIKLCVLFSTLDEPDWPDFLDTETGRFVYYGDNRKPGRQIVDAGNSGNRILEKVFEDVHTKQFARVPPFFVFTKAGNGRDVVFRGLAVPGAIGLNFQDDLVAIWRNRDGRRFQNYRATFTILDAAKISREWIQDLKKGVTDSPHAPASWVKWITEGVYTPLQAPKVLDYRTRVQQLPQNRKESRLLGTIVSYFKEHPEKEYAFEECACELAVLMDSNITEYNVTRRWRDGGRDAVGNYRIGHLENTVKVEFALEAKCKGRDHGSGIKETTRLISRIRHRQFGIFVTTSYVNVQAYKEILEDGHPIVVMCGKDIVHILIKAGHDNSTKLRKWLKENFPYQQPIIRSD